MARPASVGRNPERRRQHRQPQGGQQRSATSTAWWSSRWRQSVNSSGSTCWTKRTRRAASAWRRAV